MLMPMYHCLHPREALALAGFPLLVDIDWATEKDSKTHGLKPKKRLFSHMQWSSSSSTSHLRTLILFKFCSDCPLQCPKPFTVQDLSRPLVCFGLWKVEINSLACNFFLFENNKHNKIPIFCLWAHSWLYFYVPVDSHGWPCGMFWVSMAWIPSVLKFRLLVHDSLALTSFATVTTKHMLMRSCRWETCRNLKQHLKQLPQRVICTCSRVLFSFFLETDSIYFTAIHILLYCTWWGNCA